MTKSEESTFNKVFSLREAPQYIEQTNEALMDFAVSDIPPPPIPKELIYKSLKTQILQSTTKLASELFKLRNEDHVNEEEIVKAYHSIDKNIPFDITEALDIPDQIESIWSILSRHFPMITSPDQLHPANELLYSVYVLAPKYSTSAAKRKLQQWILCTGSNTIEQLVEHIKCPLCKIASELAQDYAEPAKIILKDGVLYNHKDKFFQPVHKIVQNINYPYSYTSSGGCSHVLLINAVYIVHMKEDPKLPSTIGGIGSFPIVCNSCGCAASAFARRLEPKGPICFFCYKCNEKIEQNPSLPCVDLSDSYFQYNS